MTENNEGLLFRIPRTLRSSSSSTKLPLLNSTNYKHLTNPRIVENANNLVSDLRYLYENETFLRLQTSFQDYNTEMTTYMLLNKCKIFKIDERGPKTKQLKVSLTFTLLDWL